MSAAPLARPAGVASDLITVAGRALRQARRDTEAVIPPVFVGVFFYAVQVGMLQDVFESPGGGVSDYRAFLLPMGILFAVTGVSRATALVTDIQGGYFDRMLVTPIARPTLLLGLMVADLVVVAGVAVAVTAAGLAMGVEIATGVVGIAASLVLWGLWALAFAGFPYAVALRTGNPAAVGSSWLLFMPFTFLSTAFVPEGAMTGWMASVVELNPVTHLLGAQRALVSEGWAWATIGRGLLATGAVFVVTFGAAMAALRRRLSRH
ncbi:ABC transporter permease [Euzebya tangerina]|uniref:ABC transporter permease n=1 Tax=Euzebya tangerina TaxID=591198 RepID=UPI000E318ACE|nr:ABC transporter permease [Euzebya tangerina]